MFAMVTGYCVSRASHETRSVVSVASAVVSLLHNLDQTHDRLCKAERRARTCMLVGYWRSRRIASTEPSGCTEMGPFHREAQVSRGQVDRRV
ncbi:hypothetical protein GCM10010349_23730 [Streptomyces flavofungini]|nr:hypothetical protein GCM10010349_23730 [Streptomyces flavofungini]